MDNYKKINPYLCCQVNKTLKQFQDEDDDFLSEEDILEDFFGGVQKPEVNHLRLISYILNTREVLNTLYESALVLKGITKASGMNLYLKSNFDDDIFQYTNKEMNWLHRNTQKIEPGKTIAAYVAFTRKYELVSDILEHENFPLGLNVKGQYQKSVLCVPLITPETNQLIGVLELSKEFDEPDFTEELFMALLMGEIPSDVLTIEVMSIMRQAMNASAFVCSVLRSEEFSNDLFYDMQINYETETCTKTIKYKPRDNVTVTADVIEKEETIILSADELTRYDSLHYYPVPCRNILSMPIKRNGEIVAVIEFLTKINSNRFTKSDELLAFRALCCFAFIVSHNQLEEERRKKILLAKILHNTLQVSLTPCIHELLEINIEEFTLPKNFHKILRLNPDEENPTYLAFLAREMFIKFAPEFVPKKMYLLNYFILLVQKGTMKLGPNNFKHVVCTMHVLYYIFCKYKHDFTTKETSEMMLAALCHELMFQRYYDINKNDLYMAEFMEESECIYLAQPLWIIKLILKQSKWNKRKSIMDKRTQLERIYRLIIICQKKFYAQEKHCLLELLSEGEFDFSNSRHRLLLMTGTLYLASMSSSFNHMRHTIMDNFLLFYDRLKNSKKNLTYNTEDEEIYGRYWLQDQIMYFKHIIIPWASIIYVVFPEASSILRNACKSVCQWIEISNTKRTWSPGLSVCPRYKY